MSAQAEMDDIISSIKASVEEESAKVGSGSVDLIDAAADEDILELTAAEMVAEEGKPAEEMIDIAAFSQTGEVKAAEEVAAATVDILGENVGVSAVPAGGQGDAAGAAEQAPTVPEGGAADEFDRLLAEISSEQKQQIVAAEDQKKALMEEETPLGADEEVAVAAPAIMPEAAAPMASPSLGASQMMDNVGGLQIALPAEVLALAIRPMVQEWMQANLSSVVEQLVKEEISKLNQG